MYNMNTLQCLLVTTHNYKCTANSLWYVLNKPTRILSVTFALTHWQLTQEGVLACQQSNYRYQAIIATLFNFFLLFPNLLLHLFWIHISNLESWSLVIIVLCLISIRCEVPLWKVKKTVYRGIPSWDMHMLWPQQCTYPFRARFLSSNVVHTVKTMSPNRPPPPMAVSPSPNSNSSTS